MTLLHWVASLHGRLGGTVDLVEEGVLEGVFGRNSLRVVQFKHAIKEVEGVSVLELADVLPCDLLFLHFIGDQAPVAVLKGNLLDGV